MNSIPILFQNERLVVVEKPALMLSVPGRFQEDERPILGRLLEEQTQRRIWPVHRLDYEVSGVMIFAFEPHAHKILNRSFETHEVHKTYQAWAPVHENSPRHRTEWKSRLLRGKKRSYESPHGDLAVTFAFCHEPQLGETPWGRWELEPRTGRSHQLRVEMAKHGSPIAGDQLYGSQVSWSCGIALRAVSLEFPLALAQELGMATRFELPPLPFEPQILTPVSK